MNYTITDPACVNAALDEMVFWLRIMSDHTKLIRGGMDPTEEQIIRTADAYAVTFDNLLAEVCRTEPINVAGVSTLVDTSVNCTMSLRDFKAALFNLASNCQVLTEIPPELFNHVREEADFFLTMLFRLKGLPVPPNEVLGIPDSNIPTSLVPRALIPFMGNQIPLIAREANLFWLRTHAEHAQMLLLIAYRPKVHEALYHTTEKFAQKLQKLQAYAEQVPVEPAAILAFNCKVRPLMEGWRDFLRTLYNDYLQCRVPTGQLNTPAVILDHMAREGDYYLSTLDLVNQSMSSPLSTIITKV